MEVAVVNIENDSDDFLLGVVFVVLVEAITKLSQSNRHNIRYRYFVVVIVSSSSSSSTLNDNDLRCRYFRKVCDYRINYDHGNQLLLLLPLF